MKYVILISSNPDSRRIWESFSDSQRADGLRAYAALNDELVDAGEWVAGEALADPSQGRRISVREGRTLATDGPYAEAKEALAGFFLVDCKDLDRAVEIAARVPEASLGLVEVRPVVTYSGMEM